MTKILWVVEVLYKGCWYPVVNPKLSREGGRHDALRLVPDLSREMLRRDDTLRPLVLRTHAGTPDGLFQRLRATFEAQNYHGLAAAIWEGPEPRLQIVAHHLWMDVVSLRLLIDEISENFQPDALPRPSAPSFLAWADALQSRALAGHFDSELGLWPHSIEYLSTEWIFG